MAGSFKGLLAGISTNNPATLAVDTALNVADLARAGYGYVGHKAGMLSADQLPEPLDRTKVPGSSDFIRDTAGVSEDDLGFMAGGFLSPKGIANAAQRGIIKKAPDALVKRYEQLKAQGWPEERIWREAKVAKAPSGQHFTEASFTVKGFDDTRLPSDRDKAIPILNILKYETDDPSLVERLKNIKVYKETERTADGSLRKVTRSDGSVEYVMGVNPNGSTPIDEIIYHELGHRARDGDFPTSLNYNNLNALHQRLTDLASKASSIKEAKMKGGWQLHSWQMRAKAAEIAGNDEVKILLMMSPKELDDKIASTRAVLAKMEKHSDSRGDYDSFKHYQSLQDEQMSRLDQHRSPLTDAQQRANFPKRSSAKEPLTDDYTDILDWERQFTDLM